MADKPEQEIDTTRLFNELTHKYIQRFNFMLLYPVPKWDLEFERPVLEMYMFLRNKVVHGEKLNIETVLRFKELITSNKQSNDSDDDSGL